MSLRAIAVCWFLGCAPTSLPMDVQLKGQFEEFMALNLVESAYIARTKLLACNEFSTEWPDRRREIEYLNQGLVIHRMDGQLLDDAESHLPVCAVARSGEIQINPHANWVSGCNYIQTLAHEMLHLAGFHDGNDLEDILLMCGLKALPK